MKTLSFLPLVLGSFACGGAAQVVDSGAPDAATADAGPRCDPLAPFGAAQPVVWQPTHESATLADHELTLYSIHIETPTDRFVEVATRASRTDAFGQPTSVESLFGESFSSAHVTGDGLGVYLTGNADDDLYFARWVPALAGFGDVTRLETLNTTGIEGAPAYSVSEDALYFHRRTEPDLLAIYRAPAEGMTFGSPEVVAELDDPAAHEGWPVVSQDGREILFSRRVDVGPRHIYRASRPTLDAPFGTPELVAELSMLSAMPTWLAPDGCVLYFTKLGPAPTGISFVER